MCRFTVYKGKPMLLADVITRPSRSIIMQSYHCTERLPTLGSSFNADGFGVGWYGEAQEGTEACVFKSDRPAWSNQNLKNIANNVQSHLIFAHVRAATPDCSLVTEVNCQPFQYGKFLFMHNGQVGDFRLLRRKMVDHLSDEFFGHVKGTTDSEMCFAIFLNKLHARKGPYKPKDLIQAVQETLSCIMEMSKEAGCVEESLLNWAITDGQTVIATRFASVGPASSLYFSSGNTFDCHKGEYRMQTSHKTDTSIIISSEPLTDAALDWVEVPRNHMVVSTPDSNVLILPLEGNITELAPVLADIPVLDSDTTSGLSLCLPDGSDDPCSYQQTKTDPTCHPTSPITPITPHGGSGPKVSGFLSSTAPDACSMVKGCAPQRTYSSNKIKRVAWNAQQQVPASRSKVMSCNPESFRSDVSPLQVLTGHTKAVLAVAVNNHLSHLYTGCLDEKVRVFDLYTMQQLACIEADEKVLCLAVDAEEGLLYIVSTGTTLQQWDMNGDPILLRSLMSPGSKMYTARVLDGYLYSGGVDAQLHWLPLPAIPDKNNKNPEDTLGHFDDKWDSCPAHCGSIFTMAIIYVPSNTTMNGMSPHIPTSRNMSMVGRKVSIGVIHHRSTDRLGENGGSRSASFFDDDVDSGDDMLGILLTASGDGLIKGWTKDNSGPDVYNLHVYTFTGHAGAVVDLTVASKEEPVFYSASLDGTVKVWDVLTQSCLHSLQHPQPLCAISAEEDFLVSVDKSGLASVWSRFPHAVLTSFSAAGSKGKFLALGRSSDFLITAALSKNKCSTTSDVCLWDLGMIEVFFGSGTFSGNSNRSMISTLSKFISFKTVSSDLSLVRENDNAAFFLKGVIERLIPCPVRVVKTASHYNPVVFAHLKSSPDKPTLIIYGHYDVVAVNSHSHGAWNSDPFRMTGKDGYYYGRGTTDNKGPIVATVHAIYELLNQCQEDAFLSKDPKKADFPVNIVLVYEGSQETDSGGMEEACLENQDWFENIDVNNACILVQNTYWLGEKIPCLVYGMRGVIQLHLEVQGPAAVCHSGIDGGCFREPMNDLVALLGTLTDHESRCNVPGFYDDINPMTPEEEEHYENLYQDFNIESYMRSRGIPGHPGNNISREDVAKLLKKRWCEPSLCIHGIESSVSEFSLIPHKVMAKISVRTVDGQHGRKIATKLTAFLHDRFNAMNSANILSVSMDRMVDPWRGNPSSIFYQAADQAICSVWKQEPLYIKEGGTMRNLLNTVLPGCPTMHLPMGQASDNAHLSNERIRWENLVKGKNVLKELMVNLGKA